MDKPTPAGLVKGFHDLSTLFFEWCDARSIEPSKRQARNWIQGLDAKGMCWKAR